MELGCRLSPVVAVAGFCGPLAEPGLLEEVAELCIGFVAADGDGRLKPDADLAVVVAEVVVPGFVVGLFTPADAVTGFGLAVEVVGRRTELVGGLIIF